MRSYRIDQPRPKPKHRSMQDTATPGEIFIHNGCTASLAIPCWYIETRPPIPAHCHDRMHHDMIGWPTPTHPDHCCQEWDFDRHHCRRTPHLKCCPPHCEHFLDMGRLIPIHFKDEGYKGVSVQIVDADGSDASDTVECEAWFDEQDDWIIRVSFHPQDPKLQSPGSGSKTFYYSVFVNDGLPTRDMNQDRPIRDLVTIGKLTVLPCPTYIS